MSTSSSASETPAIIVFGGGCFWCTEAVFSELKGVVSVMPGYAGGNKDNPTYDQVSMGNTGHAEVIRVEYDSEKISLHDLLTVFFGTHDPTTPNRQGADIGTQYRSTIMTTTPEQLEETKAFIKDLDASHIYNKPVVTEVTHLNAFWQAEEYHKDYYKNNPDQMYCQAVINPKLAKFRKRYGELVKK